jgi:PAS domain S-box-containing protein
MQHPYLKLGALVALVFWLIDSSLHYFAYSEESFEFIPSDIDELWMRILICVILVAFGWYVDYARQTSERDLRASESYFRGLVESSTEIVWRINTEGILTYISPSVKQVLDYEPNELLGLRFELQLADPESRQKVLRLLTQRRLGDLGSEPIVYELQYLHRDGTSITTEIRSAPIMAENGEIVEEQGISRDITERSRIKEELQKMAKLESIGVLAAGIAHDLNNFLTGIVGNIALARLDDDPIARDDKLELELNNAMRIKDLTAQLLTFAKGGSPMIQPHEIGDLLKRSVDFALSGSNLVCEYTIRDDLQLVKIDEAQIRQVINCLIINAIEAMPSGGSIKVSAEMTELDSEHSVPLDPGSYVRISIEDSGVGIPEENRKQVFDPFFTTKPTGSGLGLATSLSIIQKHKGSITLEGNT